MNSMPLNIAVRVGCHLTYETRVPTPVMFVLRPRAEGRVHVMQERLTFGIGLPSCEFQDSHGNLLYRSTFMPGRNEVRHDALVAVSSLPDSRNVEGNLVPVGKLPHELLRYTLPSRYCDSDKHPPAPLPVAEKLCTFEEIQTDPYIECWFHFLQTSRFVALSPEAWKLARDATRGLDDA